WVSDDELEAPEEAPQSLEQEPPSPDYLTMRRGSRGGPEEDPANYPADRGDDDNDDDDDDKEEEEEEEASKEDEEEEHLALANSTTLPAARIFVRPQTSMSTATKALIAMVAAALPSSPPPSPLPHIPSPLLTLSSPPTHTSLAYVEAPLGYRATVIQ
ncbi:hypothetical protein Tco_0100308, partial [Tanacetum coccineum]